MMSCESEWISGCKSTAHCLHYRTGMHKRPTTRQYERMFDEKDRIFDARQEKGL